MRWIYVKDVPNVQLRHIRLENNENKPVTNSRDTQEVPHAKGLQVLRIMHSYRHSTSIFDDFIHYEKDKKRRTVESSHRTKITTMVQDMEIELIIEIIEEVNIGEEEIMKGIKIEKTIDLVVDIATTIIMGVIIKYVLLLHLEPI